MTESAFDRRRLLIPMIRKYSATVHGHRTSFSLEPEFMEELRRIADVRGIALAALIGEVDDARGTDSNLSSAIRLHVLAWLKQDAEKTLPSDNPEL